MKKMNIFKISMISLSGLSLTAPIYTLASCSKYVKTINSTYLDIRSGVLYGLKDEYLYKDKLEKATKLVIPKEVKSIAPYAFVIPVGGVYHSTLPQKLETIEFDSSSQCEEIMACAFTNCTVKEITLPNTIQSIHVGAFAYCKYLSKIDISSFSYKQIENLCDNITANKKEETELGGDPFTGLAATGSLVYNSALSATDVSKADFKLYANTDVPYAWFGREIKVDKPLYYIDYDSTLKGFNSNLTEEEMKVLFKDQDKNSDLVMYIPSNVVSVDPYAFYQKINEEWVSTIPSYISCVDFTDAEKCLTIGKGAFKNATFKYVIFSQYLTKVETLSFDRCEKIEILDLSQMTYKDDIFEEVWLTGCSENEGTIITKEIPKGEKHDDLQIEENAKWWSMFTKTTDLFKSDECWSFKHTEIYKRNIFTTDQTSSQAGPAHLNGIKSEYSDTKNVINYKGSYILGSIFQIPTYDEYNNPYCFIDDYAFFNNGTTTSKIPSFITEANLENSIAVGSIGRYAFLNAPFKSVKLPSNLVEIESCAFGATENTVCPLQMVTIPASCVSIDADAFTKCSNLVYINMAQWKEAPSIPVVGATGPFWYEKSFTGLPKTGVFRVSVALYTDELRLQQFKTTMSHVMYDYEGNPIKFAEGEESEGWYVI